MNAKSGVDLVEDLYAAGDDRGLLEFARNFWSYHGSSHPESPEVARFARVAAFRSATGEDELWQARAVEAAYFTGAWRSLALSLQQYFFRPLALGNHEAAEGVLAEMERLAQQEHEGLPTKELVNGILAERRALLLTERAEWLAAANFYEKALDFCPDPSRRFLKVKGGLVRSKWLAGGDHATAATAFESLAADGEPYPDVHSAALTNLAAARAEDRMSSVPFDLV